MWGDKFLRIQNLAYHKEYAHSCSTIWIIWEKRFPKYKRALCHVSEYHKDFTKLIAPRYLTESDIADTENDINLKIHSRSRL